MQSFKIFFITLFLFLYNVPTSKAIDISSDSIPSSAQKSLIENTANLYPNNTQISIAIIKNGEVAYYGLERKHGHLEQIANENRVFEIGSITKVFTSHLLANLYKANIIKDLNDPVNPILDFQIKGNQEITYAQLASHTSGMRDNLSTGLFSRKNPFKKYELPTFKKYLSSEVAIDSKAGERYSYSNSGMGLLGYAVTKLGNASYEDMLQNQIFKPLNMTSSTSNRKDVASKLVKGRNKKGKPAPNWDMAAFEGAGAILSTVSDLAKYTLWNFKALQNELQVMKELRFKTSEENGVALGWHIKNLSASSPVYWHNGATGGYKSCMAMDLEQQNAVIILSNVAGSNNAKRRYIDTLCFDLLDTLSQG